MITVSSKDRIYGSTSSFRVSLTDTVVSVKRFRLLHACIPYSFYDIEASAVLLFQEIGGGGILNAPLTPGSYTPTQLAAEVQLQLNTHTANAYVYTVSYNTENGRYTISCTGQFKILWTTMYSGVYANGLKDNLPYQLGFTNSSPDAIPDPDGTFATSTTSTGVGTIAWRNTLWVVVQPQFPNRILNTSNASISYLVPVNGNFMDKLFFDINNGFDQALDYGARGSTCLVELEITVRDEDNNIVDLNGVDCSFVFGYCTY